MMTDREIAAELLRHGHLGTPNRGAVPVRGDEVHHAGISQAHAEP